MASLIQRQCHRISSNPACRPGCLKVEATGDPVDVEQLTREKKSGTNPALHGFEVHLAEPHAATCDEFLFVQALAADRQLSSEELLRQVMLGGAREAGPAGIWRNPRSQDEFFPQAARQRREGSIDNESRGLGLASGLELGGDRFGALVRQPIELEGKLISEAVQRSCPPGREPKDHRAAHTPMGNEQGPAFLQFGVRHRCLDRFDRNPGQLPQPGRGNVKCEERRDGRFQRMAERDGQVSRSQPAAPARRQEQPITNECFPIGEPKFKTSLRTPDDSLEAAVCQQFYPRPPGLAQQAINDGLRGITEREHPPILLGLQLYPSRFKPRDRVPGLKDLERTQQRVRSAWIPDGKLSHLETGMSDVTASTS